MTDERRKGRERRHARVRKKVSGTTERPRLSVYRSLNNMYAQVIDDTQGKTLAAASSLVEGLKQQKGNVQTSKAVGGLIAKMAMDRGIKKVVFDKGGYLYHGRVKALAEAAREAGLEF